MDYTFLFTKNDAICFEILERFTQEANQTLAKEELVVSLSLTTYQLNKYFDNMNTDLAMISDGTPSYLDEINKGQWHAYNVDSFHLQKMALLYLSRSPLFTALEYQFFYDNLYTKREYVSANFMSNSVFYRSLDSLEDILKSHGFYQASSLYIDKEFTVRLHLFQLYYTMYNSVADPFEDLNPLIEDLITTIQATLEVEFDPTQETKLTILLRI